MQNSLLYKLRWFDGYFPKKIKASKWASNNDFTGNRIEFLLIALLRNK